MRKIQSNDLIVYDVELSELVNRKLNVMKLKNKEVVYSESDILHMYELLSEANIKDSNIRNLHVELLKREENKDDAGSHMQKGTCKTCGKEVSEKVKQFCLSNKERFNGNIYCFDHQNNR